MTPLEKAAYEGAKANYDQWRSVGPVELPDFEHADPHIAKVFLDRAHLILTTALKHLVVTP